MGRESLPTLPSPTSVTAAGTTPAATTLAPGFRFHPTDEELVSYFLKRKVLNKPLGFDAIAEVDIYKHEPWDLAVFSKLKTRDEEWYFFSQLDKKNGSKFKMNRTTNIGYWKATGQDREIRSEIQLLGMKKTLVFHSGRAPDGLRTNWVMHEYRLVEDETEINENLLEDAYVLCRVFHKNNFGPPSGNRYAPFNEEEWADDNRVALIPGVEQLLIANGNNQMDLQNHHEKRLKLQADNKSHDHDEDAEKDERPRPLTRLQCKRKRQNKSSNNSSRITQNHCSSTTTLISSSSAAFTNTALLEFSLIGISDKRQNSEPPTPSKEASPPPPPSTEEKIKQMSVERETFKVEMMSAEAMISILQSRIVALRQENNELKEKNVKGQ